MCQWQKGMVDDKFPLVIPLPYLYTIILQALGAPLEGECPGRSVIQSQQLGGIALLHVERM
jgi:hypothetical protein